MLPGRYMPGKSFSKGHGRWKQVRQRLPGSKFLARVPQNLILRPLHSSDKFQMPCKPGAKVPVLPPALLHVCLPATQTRRSL